jgi:hypothetical protein
MSSFANAVVKQLKLAGSREINSEFSFIELAYAADFLRQSNSCNLLVVTGELLFLKWIVGNVIGASKATSLKEPNMIFLLSTLDTLR